VKTRLRFVHDSFVTVDHLRLFSYHLRCHHLSFPLPFARDLKLICLRNALLHSLSGFIWTAFRDIGLGLDLLGTEGVCLF